MTGGYSAHGLEPRLVFDAPLLPTGAAGIDAGMTMTKMARGQGAVVELTARERTAAGSRPLLPRDANGAVVGITGAYAAHTSPREHAVHVPEIDAAARGVTALLEASGAPAGEYVLALLGTGTAFAAVRDGRAAHLGGTALGGGSFAGIARRIHPSLRYAQMLEGAERGDRRRADVMVADVYPEGIGRIGPDLTAAHLAGAGGSLDDTLAALLNLHAESIAQIAASRAIIAKVGRIVLAGGFAHNNSALIASIAQMTAMFGVPAEVAPVPGYAGAIGAAIIAAGA